ncbi:hypothetical protein BK139_06450 [Paenibacillus sp. FSL R5-0490]|uniref:flagellin lysine-N-methylase n=1 Tax=Paenibacillus sp. FSL R5-0490 TaxID=1920424 RepID=UPI00096E00BA|nr:flagellin lysine-N-methylase [Paenibacillus sp. FSL R5-0490]OMF61478.1 hypothetical protein BK139_06450 [Paenibacillus sp. FSL R5-0490]
MKEKTLHPVYMKDFKCIGPECEDTCCASWTISIDKKSYKKYKKIANPSFQKKFKEGIKRIKDSNNSNENYYAKMKLDEKSQCSFLTDDKLCGIQQQFGESYLCHTCSVYPRIINKLDDNIEKSGTVSCPEIARLALLNKEGIQFEIIEVDKPYQKYNGELQSNDFKLNSLEHNYWNIRFFIIEILQERSIKLWERLLYIGLFVQKIQSENYTTKSELNNLISTFKYNLVNSNVSDLFKQIPVNMETQYKILKLIAEARQIEGINHPKFQKHYNDFLKGISYSSSRHDSENLQDYKEALRFYLEIEREIEYIFENYLVNYVFQTMFPLNTDGNYMREYSYLILHYVLIRLHLVGIKANLEGNFNEYEIVSFIQSFSRNVGHNKGYLQKVYKFLEENSLNNLGSYTILLKN